MCFAQVLIFYYIAITTQSTVSDVNSWYGSTAFHIKVKYATKTTVFKLETSYTTKFLWNDTVLKQNWTFKLGIMLFKSPIIIYYLIIIIYALFFLEILFYSPNYSKIFPCIIFY